MSVVVFELEAQIGVRRLSLGCGSIEKLASELRKTATKAAEFSNLLAVTSLNRVKVAIASIVV